MNADGPRRIATAVHKEFDARTDGQRRHSRSLVGPNAHAEHLLIEAIAALRIARRDGAMTERHRRNEPVGLRGHRRLTHAAQRTGTRAVFRRLQLQHDAVMVTDVNFGRTRWVAPEVCTTQADLDAHCSSLLALLDTMISKVTEQAIRVEAVHANAHVVDARCPHSARWVR